jgi:hypothetical protein
LIVLSLLLSLATPAHFTPTNSLTNGPSIRVSKIVYLCQSCFALVHAPRYPFSPIKRIYTSSYMKERFEGLSYSRIERKGQARMLESLHQKSSGHTRHMPPVTLTIGCAGTLHPRPSNTQYAPYPTACTRKAHGAHRIRPALAHNRPHKRQGWLFFR